MPLPVNFSGYPGEEPHRYFRNLCREFKKIIIASKDSGELQDQMERFINVSKEMDWHHKTSGVYHKEEGEKAVDRVWSAFKRYISDLQTSPEEAKVQDLLSALVQVEKLIDSLKVS